MSHRLENFGKASHSDNIVSKLHCFIAAGMALPRIASLYEIFWGYTRRNLLSSYCSMGASFRENNVNSVYTHSPRLASAGGKSAAHPGGQRRWNTGI